MSTAAVTPEVVTGVPPAGKSQPVNLTPAAQAKVTGVGNASPEDQRAIIRSSGPRNPSSIPQHFCP